MFVETPLEALPDNLSDCYINITLNRKDCGSTPINRDADGVIGYCDGSYGLLDELHALLPDASEDDIGEACANIETPILTELYLGTVEGSYQGDVLAGVEVFVSWRLTRITEAPQQS